MRATAASGTPTGSVSFTRPGAPAQAVPVTPGGTAEFSTSTLPLGASIPTGTVRLRIDGIAVAANVTLARGRATDSTRTLAIGRHTVTAVYRGDARFTGSTSAGITQRIR